MSKESDKNKDENKAPDKQPEADKKLFDSLIKKASQPLVSKKEKEG